MASQKEVKFQYKIKEGRQDLSLDDQIKGLPFMRNNISEFVSMLQREGGSQEWADIFD